MSKYVKKKSGNKGLVMALVIGVLALLLAIACLAFLEKDGAPSSESDTPTGSAQSVPSTSVAEEQTAASQETSQATADEAVQTEAAPENVQVDDIREMNRDLGQGLVIMDIGRYAGIYMEDGSDEVVSGVMMLVLTNQNEMPLEYAQIQLTSGDQTATFTASTVPAGASVVLLEQNRMEYEEDMEFTQAQASMVSFFDEPLSLCEDKVQVQGLNGVMNIINVSGEDITGDIEVYYKNSSQDMYYGGITYRVRISGGLKADEVKQIVSDHFSEKGSTVMFVKCG